MSECSPAPRGVILCLASDYAAKWPDVEPLLGEFHPTEQQLMAESCWFSGIGGNGERMGGGVARKRQDLPVA